MIYELKNWNFYNFQLKRFKLENFFYLNSKAYIASMYIAGNTKLSTSVVKASIRQTTKVANENDKIWKKQLKSFKNYWNNQNLFKMIKKCIQNNQ